MIDIVHRYTKENLFHSETAQTIAEAAVEAVKKGSDLSGSDLRGSDLRGSDLSDSNLMGSDLRGSNLRGSNLSCSNLMGSNLSYSDLRGSNLMSSNLSYSDLRGSNLSGSDLSDSNLRGSDLSYSNLMGSNLMGSDLRGSDLRGSDLPVGYRIASLCFGGWAITVMPTETQIGCERHPNASWLTWTTDSPEIAAMHPDAAAWWAKHRETVCAVIKDVQKDSIHAEQKDESC